MTGRTISHYHILEKLGEGGMGVVYKAEDTRLNRTVAIKVLPADKLSDAQARERFEREARAISSLNHPNICTLYDFAHEDGVDCLVMEYVDGNPLQGPMPLRKALRLGAQIADALDHAHRNGIVHRDLKPGNILATKAGVKLLDFGLAKFSRGPERVGEQEVTLTRAITQDGAILGTFHYMSPEQWEGKEADPRSDIFAFGAVLFEMLTGRKAFDGKSQASLIGAILKDDPPSMSSLGLITPPGLEYIVKTCLSKDPDDRWQTARDLGRELKRVASGDADSDGAAVASALPRGRKWQRPAPLALAALVLLALASLVTWNLTRSTIVSRPGLTRTSINVSGISLMSTGGSPLALSPDGTTLAFVGERDGAQQAYLRRLDTLTVAPIPGTDGADSILDFSPDGASVLIGTNVGTGIKRVSVTGGPAIDIVEGGHVWSADWGQDDTIVFSLNGTGLVEVSAGGGEATPLVSANGVDLFLWPDILPDGRAVVFTVWSEESDSGQIAVVSRATGETRRLLEGSYPRFLEPGHLVFMRDEALWAVPFDARALEITGSPAPLVEQMSIAGWGRVDYAVSRDGALVYLPAGATAGAERALVWVDREGHQEVITTGLVDPRVPRLSPDGNRVAFDAFARSGEDQRDIWIYELARATMSRFTFRPGFDGHPVWSPDGERIAYLNGGIGIVWRAADGTGDIERLTSRVPQCPTEFAPDGRSIVFFDITSETGPDVYSLSLDGAPEATPLVRTSASETAGSVSPDGRWLAYQSNESGAFEIYVRPFPKLEDGRWQVSSDGGTEPLWARNGRELFYRDGTRMMRVPVALEPAFAPGQAEVLFEGRYQSLHGRNYDIAPDDQRFLMIKDVDTDVTASPLTEFVFIQNWTEEVSARVPTN